MSHALSRPAPPLQHNLGHVRDRPTLAALHALTLLPPPAARAHRRIGLMQARSGRPAAAIKSLEAALAGGLTTRADIHHQLGQALLATARAGDAAEHFRRACELGPAACWSWQGLGQALAAAGRQVEAEAAFRRGLKVCPGHGWLTYHLARILIGQQRDADALDLLIETGAAEAGDPPPSLPSMSIFVRTELATAEGIASLRKIVARFPDHADYMSRLTRLLTVRGEHELVAKDYPCIKLILLLRDPISRAYSAYRMDQRTGRELRPWEAVVEAELTHTPVCPLQPEDIPSWLAKEGASDYLAQSAALPFLRHWPGHFTPEQFLILHHDELRRDTAGTVRRVYRFLGLPDFVPDCTERHNAGRYEPISPAIRQRLEDWFAPHQQALGELLASMGVAPASGQTQRDRER